MSNITEQKAKLAKMRAQIDNDEPYLQDDPGGHGARAQDKLRREAAELENSILLLEMAEMKRKQMPDGWHYDHESGMLYCNREPFARLIDPSNNFAALSAVAAATIVSALNPLDPRA